MALGGSACADVDFFSGVRRLLFHVVNQQIRVDFEIVRGSMSFILH